MCVKMLTFLLTEGSAYILVLKDLMRESPESVVNQLFDS